MKPPKRFRLWPATASDSTNPSTPRKSNILPFRPRSKPVPQVCEADRYFGECLRQAREQAGMTRAALGRALWVSSGQIKRYEVNLERMPVSVLIRAALVIDLPPKKPRTIDPHEVYRTGCRISPKATGAVGD